MREIVEKSTKSWVGVKSEGSDDAEGAATTTAPHNNPTMAPSTLCRQHLVELEQRQTLGRLESERRVREELQQRDLACEMRVHALEQRLAAACEVRVLALEERLAALEAAAPPSGHFGPTNPALANKQI